MEPAGGSGTLFGALAVLLLVAANAFFVAAEFALVASRRTRLEALVRRGDRAAAVAQRAVSQLDRYISGTQLGITLASLGLGWIGEPVVARTIEGLFAGLPRPLDVIATHAWAGAIAFIVITFLHIVLGELAPKALALLHPEQTSRWVAGPLIAFTVATNPFIWLLNGSANALLKLFGARRPSERERVHSPEELMMLVEQSQRSGTVQPQSADVIGRVFEFTEKTAQDVMTPRIDMVTFPADLPVPEAADAIARGGRSRYPVYGESADDIVGVVHAKDVLRALRTGPEQTVGDLMHPPLVVPATREVEDVLTDMKRAKQHLAIVLDEYGGTAGLVTMEDLLEELVGQIYDEYDQPDAEGAAPATDGVVLGGQTTISDVNDRLGLGLDDSEYNTIGGYVFGQLGRLPVVGDRVPVKGGALEVLGMRGRRVARVRFVEEAGADRRTGGQAAGRPVIP